MWVNLKIGNRKPIEVQDMRDRFNQVETGPIILDKDIFFIKSLIIIQAKTVLESPF